MYFYVYRDQAKQWRWRLVAANHRTLADSGEGYVNQRDCIHGLSLIAGAASIPIKYQS